MIDCLCALANLTGCQIKTIGQRIANPLPPCNFFNQVEESPHPIGRKFRQVLIR